jgi:hypothetical protein
MGKVLAPFIGPRMEQSGRRGEQPVAARWSFNGTIVSGGGENGGGVMGSQGDERASGTDSFFATGGEGVLRGEGE